MAEPICEEYNYYASFGFGFFAVQGYHWTILLLTKGVNVMFTLLASKIRFASKSAEAIYMTLSIFSVNMVIYGIVPYLATADLRKKHEDHILTQIFSGMYFDFNAEWFQDVGLLVSKTMIANIFMPPVLFALGWLVRYLYRVCDQGCSFRGDLKNTKSRSIQQFTDLYSGGVFYIY